MKMPFGRYKGVELADLPLDYLAWLRANVDLRPPLLGAVAEEWAARHAPPSTTPVSPEVRLMAEELLTSGYRNLAKTYHPDRGGDGRAMVLVNAAVAWLRSMVRNP